ncbi:MAG: hypothetical protein DRG78_10860 [Epsilonproteobacteria bacterium]|nr:MAG: hypothetical protein DRG78_10860 [Campylobacterota bacterium]
MKDNNIPIKQNLLLNITIIYLSFSGLLFYINYETITLSDAIVQNTLIVFVLLFILLIVIKQFINSKYQEIQAIEKQNRKQINQAKMESMSEMIGNIAHQWRQPLSLISTTSTSMQCNIELGLVEQDEIIKNFAQINERVQYLSTTIEDFQNFLQPSNKVEMLNIKDIIEKNIAMFGKNFEDEGIELILDLNNVELTGNKDKLLIAIYNILDNAKEILMESDSYRKIIFIDLFKDAKGATIIITDNANGIDEEILPKIFDAYFTTKHKTQGTGLGLYVSYQTIINDFEGTCQVINEHYDYEDEEYIGAKFKIFLPY